MKSQRYLFGTDIFITIRYLKIKTKPDFTHLQRCFIIPMVLSTIDLVDLCHLLNALSLGVMGLW